MPTADVPDWQVVVTVVPSFVPGQDVPDWETVVTGPGGSTVGGYASLTGPGEGSTPGNLTQAGGFVVNDSGDGIGLIAASASEVYIGDVNAQALGGSGNGISWNANGADNAQTFIVQVHTNGESAFEVQSTGEITQTMLGLTGLGFVVCHTTPPASTVNTAAWCFSDDGKIYFTANAGVTWTEKV